MSKRTGTAAKKRIFYGTRDVSVRRLAPPRPATQSSAVFRTFIVQKPSAAARIQIIRTGVTARVVDSMVQYLGVSKGEIFKVLRTPQSTAHKLIKDNRPLDAGASERVVRVADVMRLAEETFGGPDAAKQWLKSPNFALENATPLSLLDTEPGAHEVRRILSAINYGGSV